MGANTSQEDTRNDENENQPPRLYIKVDKSKWPILYSSDYDISFWKLETIHPFDSSKWRRVYQILVDKEMLKGTEDTVQPLEASEEDLLVTHTPDYITSLTYSANVAMVVEVPPLALLPNRLVQSKMLRPFRFQTGGTILAGKLALDRGWAINIGGGFHHCSSGEGGGFCAYADITLSIKFLFNHLNTISKIMIIDFDAHQGNGHERDFMDDDRVYIMDMYNRWIYPGDVKAKAAIKMKIELDVHTGDETYLGHIKRKLPQALDEFQPDLVVYNAGTDVLIGDPLGILDISENGVIERDELVFQTVRNRKIPIFMVTSGGYQKSNAQVIADSIHNLYQKKIISCDEESIGATTAPQVQPPSSSSHGYSVTTEQLSDSMSEEESTEQPPVYTVSLVQPVSAEQPVSIEPEQPVDHSIDSHHSVVVDEEIVEQ